MEELFRRKCIPGLLMSWQTGMACLKGGTSRFVPINKPTRPLNRVQKLRPCPVIIDYTDVYSIYEVKVERRWFCDGVDVHAGTGIGNFWAMPHTLWCAESLQITSHCHRLGE